MTADLLDVYERQLEVEYDGETYLVRDNGAVCRISAGKRKRKYDGIWTFGRHSESRGYMCIVAHAVHRIVASAFHERPSERHNVVDHIDTNRRNNRADNLRWVTRFENLVLNPITLRRIILAFGSLDAFFDDPSALGDRVPNYSWMRPLSKEEAEESRGRLLNWAESGRIPVGGELGEWLLRSRTPVLAPIPEDKESLTPLAIQRRWRTPTEFPACPSTIGPDPLGEYSDRLRPRTVFSRNTFGDSLTEEAGQSAAFLVVASELPESSVKGWAVAKITVEDGKFIHESKGSFFTREGALNAYSKLLGIPAPYGDTIDDFAG
jgi:hypothetical protein